MIAKQNIASNKKRYLILLYFLVLIFPVDGQITNCLDDINFYIDGQLYNPQKNNYALTNNLTAIKTNAEEVLSSPTYYWDSNNDGYWNNWDPTVYETFATPGTSYVKVQIIDGEFNCYSELPVLVSNARFINPPNDTLLNCYLIEAPPDLELEYYFDGFCYNLPFISKTDSIIKEDGVSYLKRTWLATNYYGGCYDPIEQTQFIQLDCYPTQPELNSDNIDQFLTENYTCEYNEPYITYDYDDITKIATIYGLFNLDTIAKLLPEPETSNYCPDTIIGKEIISNQNEVAITWLITNHCNDTMYYTYKLKKEVEIESYVIEDWCTSYFYDYRSGEPYVDFDSQNNEITLGVACVFGDDDLDDFFGYFLRDHFSNFLSDKCHESYKIDESSVTWSTNQFETTEYSKTFYLYDSIGQSDTLEYTFNVFTNIMYQPAIKSITMTYPGGDDTGNLLTQAAHVIVDFNDELSFSAYYDPVCEVGQTEVTWFFDGSNIPNRLGDDVVYKWDNIDTIEVKVVAKNTYQKNSNSVEEFFTVEILGINVDDSIINSNCSECNGSIMLTTEYFGTHFAPYEYILHDLLSNDTTKNSTGIFNDLCPGNYAVEIYNYGDEKIWNDTMTILNKTLDEEINFSLIENQSVTFFTNRDIRGSILFEELNDSIIIKSECMYNLTDFEDYFDSIVDPYLSNILAQQCYSEYSLQKTSINQYEGKSGNLEYSKSYHLINTDDYSDTLHYFFRIFYPTDMGLQTPEINSIVMSLNNGGYSENLLLANEPIQIDLGQEIMFKADIDPVCQVGEFDVDWYISDDLTPDETGTEIFYVWNNFTDTIIKIKANIAFQGNTGDAENFVEIQVQGIKVDSTVTHSNCNVCDGIIELSTEHNGTEFAPAEFSIKNLNNNYFLKQSENIFNQLCPGDYEIAIYNNISDTIWTDTISIGYLDTEAPTILRDSVQNRIFRELTDDRGITPLIKPNAENLFDTIGVNCRITTEKVQEFLTNGLEDILMEFTSDNCPVDSIKLIPSNITTENDNVFNFMSSIQWAISDYNQNERLYEFLVYLERIHSPVFDRLMINDNVIGQGEAITLNINKENIFKAEVDPVCISKESTLEIVWDFDGDKIPDAIGDSVNYNWENFGEFNIKTTASTNHQGNPRSTQDSIAVNVEGFYYNKNLLAACSSGCNGTLGLSYLFSDENYKPTSINLFRLSDNSLVATITDSTVKNLCAEEYVLSINLANSQVIYDTINIEQIGEYINMSHKDVQCQGECNGEMTITLPNSESGYSFEWYKDGDTGSILSTQPEITNLCSGIYYVNINSENGCNLTLADTIKEGASIPQATFLIEKDTINLSNDELLKIQNNVQDSMFYFWDFGDGNKGESNLETIVHKYQDTGVYQVGLIVTNPHACSDTVTQDIVVVNHYPVSDDKNSVKPNYTIYPNPSDGFVTIKIWEDNKFKLEEIMIVSPSGKVLRHLHTNSEINIGEYRVDLNNLLNGFYIFKLKLDNKWFYHTIILNK